MGIPMMAFGPFFDNYRAGPTITFSRNSGAMLFLVETPQGSPAIFI